MGGKFYLTRAIGSFALLLGGVSLAMAGCGGDPAQPRFGSTESAAKMPPPITGGTLLALADGRTVVAADPDRDAVFVVDLPSKQVRRVALQPGDEPGRLVEDSRGMVFVALRGGGALAKIDPRAALLVERRAICPAPRGLAYDSATDVIYVACNGGELLTLSPAGGAPLRSLQLDRDLRDVVIILNGPNGPNGQLLVTRFRSAELLTVAADGHISNRMTPSPFRSFSSGDRTFFPTVAWRALPSASGGALVVHQRAVGHDDAMPSGAVSTGGGGYGAPGGQVDCTSGIVHSTVSLLSGTSDLGPPVASPFLPSMVLPVDMALSPDGHTLAVVAAGNARVPDKTSVMKIDIDGYFNSGSDCFPGTPIATGGQVVAVAFATDGRVLVQRREPATVDLLDSGTVITLTDESREDTGHAVFHSNSGGDIACASCHPEGGDDGHTWEFDTIGLRRTQSLRGGVMALAPFHWNGDMPDLRHLTDQVFVTRMGGPKLGDDQLAALSTFLDKVPSLPLSPPSDLSAVERGRALFDDPAVGCAGCHDGDHFTNLATVDVGTGGAFVVPTLRGVGARAPFLHSGCAPTLKDRFGVCGGGSHGQTAQLKDGEIADLVSYLETI